MSLAPDNDSTSWEDLPAEIQLHILSELRDLGSLGALFHASPTLFRTCGHKIRDYTEAIFASGYVCGHTAVLFRICALIQSGRLPVHTTKEFFGRVTGEAMCYYMRIRESPWGVAPRKLDDDKLADRCLHAYLERFTTLRLESNSSWQKGSRKRASRPYYADYVDGEPAGKPYAVQDLVGFEWEEEQRVLRSIWRVQLIYELKWAVLEAKVLDWEDPHVLASTPAIKRSSHLDPEEPISFYGSRYNYQKFIWPVRSKLGQLFDDRYDWHSVLHPEYEELRAIAEFIREQHGEEAGRSYRNGLLCLRKLQYTRLNTIPVLSPTPNCWRKLVITNDATRFYFRPYNSPDELAFQRQDFGHFAYFGFVWWCESRMQRYGLLKDGKSRPWAKVSHEWYRIANVPSMTTSCHKKELNTGLDQS
ncbi:hypothetical protein NLG97_g1006 [Lecanicillium saksenae]|uniref:Uncharacterized protein n=1 Tax=Lecanicillium saksenae TaxID=468837 RepID=A0ACC1R500_9HYPO|nr:hypothetical protein NLG97_g1006 [Lecanicillium saksenae]